MRQALLAWYNRNQRDLPWRRDPDPYRVLVSEIMLQQTQAERVIPFFERFVAKFPTLARLAAAPRSEVIQAWGGLGYNKRAVYLHQLAQLVEERHAGELPRDRRGLQALPGIGPYTAGAILSIAFGQDEPALDTNVRRVMARYAFRDAPEPRSLEHKTRELVPPGQAAAWNQALMDLGATVCLARKPRCPLCPLRPGCLNRDRALPLPHRRPPSYLGSTRFYRGRLLSAVRSLGAEEQTSLARIAHDLQSQGVAEPSIGWRAVGESLARDGLMTVVESEKEVTLGLPGTSPLPSGPSSDCAESSGGAQSRHG